MSEELTAREWLINGGGGHEGGEDGLRAMTVSGEGLVDFLESYRQYLCERPTEYEFGLQCSAHARKLGFDVGDGDWQDISEVVVGLFSAGRKYSESSAGRPQLSAEQVPPDLRVKVQSWANNCAVYQAQHLAEKRVESAEYHRGAKEAFQRVVDSLPSLTVSHGAPPNASPPSWAKPEWTESAAGSGAPACRICGGNHRSTECADLPSQPHCSDPEHCYDPEHYSGVRPAPPPVPQAEPAGTDVERAMLTTFSVYFGEVPQAGAFEAQLRLTFAAIRREAEQSAFEKAADFVFKNWDSKVSVAISDAIRALASRDAKPESEGDEKC